MLLFDLINWKFSTLLLFLQALHNNKSKTKIAFCEGELRETDLDKQRRDAEEKLATVEREKEMEVYQLQTMLKSSNSEIERLTTLNNELNLVSIDKSCIVPLMHIVYRQFCWNCCKLSWFLFKIFGLVTLFSSKNSAI